MDLKTNNKKILILGASSYIGRHLFAKLGLKRAVGTYYKNPVENSVHFDALSTDISDIIDNPEDFSHAVILLGYTNLDFCARNVGQSECLNVIQIKRIIDQLNISGIIPLFISTEVVFDGKKGDYIETDPVSPIIVYGSQKVQIEEYLQKRCERFLIVRLSKVFCSCCNDKSLFADWLDQLERNMPIICARDHIFSPIYIDDVVEGLVRLIQNSCKGIFHLSSRDSYSRLDLLKLLIRLYQRHAQNDINDIRMVECSLHDIPVFEKRPLNVSMRPDKFIEATGIEPGDIGPLCERIVISRFLRRYERI